MTYTTETPGFTAPPMSLIAARIAAAGRIADERARVAAVAQQAAAAYADRVLARLLDEGSVKVGMKVCHDDGWKERCVFMIDDPACRDKVIRTAHMDAEVWGIRADGTYSDECF